MLLCIERPRNKKLCLECESTMRLYVVPVMFRSAGLIVQLERKRRKVSSIRPLLDGRYKASKPLPVPPNSEARRQCAHPLSR